MSGPGKVAHIVAAMGGSGTGKTPWVVQQIARENPERLLVWDPQGDLGGHYKLGTVFRGMPELGKLAQHVATARTFRAVFQPGDDASTYAKPFAIICRLAYALGKLTLYVDELGDVVTASYAPPAWSVITRKGSHKGLRVYGAAQQPSLIDKKFWGNATLVHCGRLTYEDDQKVLARALGVTPAEIGALKDLEWIEREVKKGTPATRGKLRF